MKFHPTLLVTAALSVAALAFPTLALAQVQTFSTSAGKVEITPIYHATAKITAGGDTIYIDPAKPAKVEAGPKADLILITDIHGDHMDAADVTALSKDGTTVIAPAAVAKTITQAKVVGNGETTSWKKWKITGVPMYTISPHQPTGQPCRDKGRGNGYA